jgi:hypothetical protein
MYHAAQLAFAERNYVMAESLLRAADERGHPNSQCMLGLLYELGRAVPQDLQLALEWYHKSAAQDYADAQVSIGRCYDRGVGVPQDYGQAVVWFQKRPRPGLRMGNSNLARCTKWALECRSTTRSRFTGTARLPPRDLLSLRTGLGPRTQKVRVSVSRQMIGWHLNGSVKRGSV